MECKIEKFEALRKKQEFDRIEIEQAIDAAYAGCQDIPVESSCEDLMSLRIPQTRYCCPDPCTPNHACQVHCVTGSTRPTEPLPEAAKQAWLRNEIPPRLMEKDGKHED